MPNPANRILVKNGSAWAWFYPSKGLNDLFSQLGNPTLSGLKGSPPFDPKPKPQSSTQHTGRLRTYAETVKMTNGGGNGKGLDAGRAMGGDRGHPASGAKNMGNGNGVLNTSSGNGGRR
jgi:hypothetical protein